MGRFPSWKSAGKQPIKKRGIIRDSGTTTKYSKWYSAVEKSVDFPPWGLLTCAGKPLICTVKRRLPHHGSGKHYRRILWRSFRVPRGPNDQKNQSRSKFSISIEIFNLARKFQSRRLEFPTKMGRGGWLARKFHSRSKLSISLEISNFLIFGPSG